MGGECTFPRLGSQRQAKQGSERGSKREQTSSSRARKLMSAVAACGCERRRSCSSRAPVQKRETRKGRARGGGSRSDGTLQLKRNDKWSPESVREGGKRQEEGGRQEIVRRAFPSSQAAAAGILSSAVSEKQEHKLHRQSANGTNIVCPDARQRHV